MTVALPRRRLRLDPSAFPWARPRRELLLLVLVAAAALAPDHITNVQDWSHLCLARAVVHGRLWVDGCIGTTSDRSRYGGHLYSNKAPGESLFEVAPAEAVGLRAPATWSELHDVRLWVVRALTGGVFFVLTAFVVGRLSEGLAPGTGGLVLVTLALGTLMAPFAATSFDHDPTAALAILAFALAWSRRPLLAGLAAGTAVFVDYAAASIVLLLGAYVLLTGLRPLLRYAVGAAPGIFLLGAYDWAAFGAPWHAAIYYSVSYHADQTQGILGVRLPALHSVERVLVGTGGLLVLSPVLAAAAAGLWLLWQRGRRAEAAVCTTITAAYLIGEFSYFIPYGGVSPGPRFFIPALPFLVLGLAPALERWRLPVLVLAGASVLASTPILIDWSFGNTPHWPQSVWGAFVRLPFDRGSSVLVQNIPHFIVQYLGFPVARLDAAIAVAVVAAAAFLLALPRRPRVPT